MNRFGLGQLPDRDHASDRPAKALTHDQIAAQTKAFLARGGAVREVQSDQLRCRKPHGKATSEWARAWDTPPPNTGQFPQRKAGLA